jgi:hypothetical protein
MSLSIIRLSTHWEAAEAYTVIAFLDELRDQLWETYGEQITEMLQTDTPQHNNDQQVEIAFDDDIKF